MDTNDIDSQRDMLGRILGDEVKHVTHMEMFEIHRVSKDGEDQLVTVEIHDAGPDDSSRYSVVGRMLDGRGCTGNSSDDLEVAIATVHWWDLDTPKDD